MPEYVAGLQFETVFLIHVDAREALPDAGMGARRQAPVDHGSSEFADR
jgi:hypothetical protein